MRNCRSTWSWFDSRILQEGVTTPLQDSCGASGLFEKLWVRWVDEVAALQLLPCHGSSKDLQPVIEILDGGNRGNRNAGSSLVAGVCFWRHLQILAHSWTEATCSLAACLCICYSLQTWFVGSKFCMFSLGFYCSKKQGTIRLVTSG